MVSGLRNTHHGAGCIGPVAQLLATLATLLLRQTCNADRFGPKTSQRGPISLRILLDAALRLCGCVCPGHALCCKISPELKGIGSVILGISNVLFEI